MNFHVLIMRLSPFRDVVKSTTHQFLYGECRRVLDDDCIDFAFLPVEQERRRGVDLCGMRTGRHVADFDLILVSNSFAVELINLPYMLKLASIPYSSVVRADTGRGPLIVMGGSNSLASQAVLFSRDDAMVDALYIGEGECGVTELVKALAESTPENRRTTLAGLQGKIDGVRVFGVPLKAKIKKSIYGNSSTELLSSAKQALFDSDEATTVRLQISYGCPSFCTFCFEGWERKPYREIPYAELLRAAASVRKETGADTVEVSSFNFNTHTDIVRLLRDLNRMFFQVNFMSQRADILAENKSLAEFEVAAGKTQYTLGIEGISDSMRAYFNKNLSRAQIGTAVTLLLRQKIREIKLFFIVSGLENDEDIADFRDLLAEIAEIKSVYNDGVRILCSFGLLVRMPFTPLRYEKLLLTTAEWVPVVDKIRRTVESAGYEFRLTYPYEEYFLSQALVSANSYVGSVLQNIAERGFVYDRTLPDGVWDFYKTSTGIDDSFCAEKDETYPFAFEFVDCGIPSSILYRRYCEAKSRKETSTCMGASCSGCGACNGEHREWITQHEIKMPSYADCTEIADIVREKARATPVYVLIDIPEDFRCAASTTKAAYVMRHLFQATETDIPVIMTVRDILFGGKKFNNQLPYWYGRTEFAVYPFSNSGRPELMKRLSRGGYTVSDTEIVPGKIRMEITNSSIRDQRLLEKTASNLLDTMHVLYILSRKNDTTFLSIVPKSLKKHIVDSCIVKDGTIFLECTEKANLSILRSGNFVVKTEV